MSEQETNSPSSSPEAHRRRGLAHLGIAGVTVARMVLFSIVAVVVVVVIGVALELLQ